MTKVTLRYDLTRPLTDDDLANIGAIHREYGMTRVQVAPGLDRLIVDYDASRLMKTDVEAKLAQYGLPIKAHAPVA